MIDFEKLAVFNLSKGAHKSAAEGVCAMEAVAWLEGLAHTDAPACTCPAIAAYVRVMNDKLSDTDRQRLVAYLPRLVGTVGGLKVELERAAIFAQTAGEIDALFQVLDMALAHGPQSPLRFSQPLDARVADYVKLVGAEA